MNATDVLKLEDCERILENAGNRKPFNIVGYRFEGIENLVEGFLSSSQMLVIDFVSGEGSKQSVFFAKTLPRGNDFHEKYVLSTGGFEKEVFFFDKVKPNLDVWCSNEVMPKCYLALPNKIIVLELITGYRVKDISEYFSPEDLKASIASVSAIHAASMMCESKNGLDLKAVWGEYFYDALYLRKEGHLGFKHTCNGIRAIKSIIEKNYPEIGQETKNKVFELYDNLPESILPSAKYRNVISHGDLYTNNIMLSTTRELTAKIFDFQLFRFNPPALDLLMLIYLTTDPRNLEDLGVLTDFYYDQVSSNLSRFGFDVSAELPKAEFQQSVEHYRPLSVAVALLFQHYVNLPPATLRSIMDDPVFLKKFILDDRTDVVLSSFEFDASYRNKLSTTISILFDSV